MPTYDLRSWTAAPQEPLPERVPAFQRITSGLARFLGRAVAGFLVATLLLTLIYRWLPIPVTPLMMIRVQENLVDGNPIRLERDWIALEDMSKRLQSAVIAAEDMKFYEHNGFDWEAIEKALRHNERRPGRIRGGSTISQQVAKNAFLWPSRSWIRKGLEAYFTGLIELLWGKARIMEVYLNIVELGDGVYGVESASQRYFKKSAHDLNSSEAALIAAVLPNPRRFLITKPSPYVRFRQTMIQRRMPSAALLIPPAVTQE